MILPALLPLLAVPQGAAAPAQDGLPGPLHVFTMGMGDLSLLVQHPKDAGLLRAMNMLDERLAELPDEMGGEMPPPLATAFTPESIPTWLHLLSSKKSLRYDLDPAGMRSGMPLLISVAVHEDSDESAALFESDLRGQLESMQAPVPPGMIRRDGSSLLLGNGKNPGPIGTTRAAGMLGGAPLAFEMSMDIGGYVDFFQSMMDAQGAPPEAAMVFDIISRMGLDEMTVEIASSVDAEKSTTTSVMTGIGGKMREAGLLPEGGLTTAHLAPIPADAKWANVQRLDLLAGFDALNGIASEIMASQGAGGDAAEMLASTIGLDLRAGLFGALGDTYGMYASDTTGGGGIASTVLFFSLRDSEALLETKEQLEEMINGLAAMQIEGYAQARTWTRGDSEYTTMTFPGLPVPLEPTMAMDENWLVIAATPQAALSAMGQINGGGNSLASHPAIGAAIASGDKNGLAYMDAAHYARSGYSLTSMGMSAVSNAVRSRVDGLRDPGPILPVFNEFVEGILPTITTTTLQGDDIVSHGTADGSTVVQTAATIGFIKDIGLLLAVPIGAAVFAEQSGAPVPGLGY